MSMSVTVECRPMTLNEAEVADEILAAVAAVLEKHEGEPGTVEHTHEVRRYPHHPSNDQWHDVGLVVKRVGYLHKDGAPIPLLREIRVGD